MPKRKSDPTLRSRHFNLGDSDSEALVRIAQVLAERAGVVASDTDALRWAIREFDRRLREGDIPSPSSPR